MAVPSKHSLDYEGSSVDYVGSSVAPSDDMQAARIVLTAIAFAFGNLVIEFIIGYILKYVVWIDGRPPAGPEMTDFRDDFTFDMVMRTIWCFCAAIIVLLVQCMYQPSRSDRWRRHWWLAAISLGAVDSCFLWGLWGLSRAIPFAYPGSARFAIAMGCAFVGGVLLVKWRHIPIMSTSAEN